MAKFYAVGVLLEISFNFCMYNNNSTQIFKINQSLFIHLETSKIHRSLQKNQTNKKNKHMSI